MAAIANVTGRQNIMEMPEESSRMLPGFQGWCPHIAPFHPQLRDKRPSDQQ